jgi:hypothetical protein
MARKKAARRFPMKSVAKVVTPTTRQLSLDFEGSNAATQKTGKSRAKAPQVRQAPASIDIPEKPEG